MVRRFGLMRRCRGRTRTWRRKGARGAGARRRSRGRGERFRVVVELRVLLVGALIASLDVREILEVVMAVGVVFWHLGLRLRLRRATSSSWFVCMRGSSLDCMLGNA